ncbi:LINE-type retrotransposon LIb DNA [Striga asiatica]|uniref:LINE-type retrotransposon LIb DNA n=1 Tax=Striga asiatica TaxID=4170 RepID=A0A5A7NYE2_STRAF|nr:LINE-type retrotransposon LIb DNA [Striga asiatica]
MEDNGRSWNGDLLNVQFKHDEIEVILRVKNLDPGQKDRWELDITEGSLSVAAEKKGEDIEAAEHLFFKCMRAILTWKLALVQWDDTENELISFKHWWWSMCSVDRKIISEDRIQLTTYILWWHWQSRNLWKFKGSLMTEVTVVNTAVKEWAEFRDRLGLGCKIVGKKASEGMALMALSRPLNALALRSPWQVFVVVGLLPGVLRVLKEGGGGPLLALNREHEGCILNEKSGELGLLGVGRELRVAGSGRKWREVVRKLDDQF